MIFGFLPLLAWHRARHIGQRFVYPHRALVLGEERTEEEMRKSLLVAIYATKHTMATRSFCVALGIMMGFYYLITIAFIFIAALRHFDKWIFTAVPVALGLLMIPIGVALHRRFFKELD